MNILSYYKEIASSGGGEGYILKKEKKKKNDSEILKLVCLGWGGVGLMLYGERLALML